MAGGTVSDVDVEPSSFLETIPPAVPQLVSKRELPDFAAAAFEQSRQAICVTDADLDLPGPIIRYVNPAYTEVFGCREVDVLGRSPRFAQGPLTSRIVLDRLRERLQRGESIRAQAINYRIDRTPFWLRWSIDPLRRDGEIVYFVAMLRDVTTEERMRRRLAAVDTMMSAGRSIVADGEAGSERAASVARALRVASARLVADLATVTVRVNGEESSSRSVPEEDGWESRIDVPAIGSLVLQGHPDAEPLVDSMAISEMVEQATWLMTLDVRRS